MKKFLFFIILQISFFNCQSLFAQWQPTSLRFCEISCIDTNATNIFVGTYDKGVFSSTDNGTSWKEINSGLPDETVSSLAISGKNIFAGTFPGGVFLSTNNGINWIASNKGLPTTKIYSLAISDTNIFAGTENGLFLSTNNGTNWANISNRLSDTTDIAIFSLIINGENIFVGNGEKGIYLSTNNGTSWNNDGLVDQFVTAIASSGSNIFAAIWEGGVLLSTNNGKNWNTVRNGLIDVYKYQVTSLAISGTNIFAGINNLGVFLSTNNGTNWKPINLGLQDSTQVLELAVNKGYVFVGCYEIDTVLYKRSLSNILNSFSIEGNITYDNKNSTPLQNSLVYVLDSINEIIDSVRTDLNGHYLFSDIYRGNYSIEVIPDAPWGGVDMLDILILDRWLEGLYTFNDTLLESAGDVDGNGSINPIDVLELNKVIISGSTNPFGSRDWLESNSSVTLSGEDVTKNIKMVCRGDVNGSYVP